MRLGTLFLTLAMALPGQSPNQTPKTLPWASAHTLPWTPGPTTPAEPAPAIPSEALRNLAVTLSGDGALRITDEKGTIQLRLGLPGRVLKIWRDGGVPVDPQAQLLNFPGRTPLMGGIGGLRLGSPDFRPGLEGLLWMLDDDERVITVLHPATSRVAYLPLPGGVRGVSLVFRPDRLEVQETQPGSPPRIEAVSWSIPWLGLLPQFIQLGQAKPRPAKEGTALLPFPKE